MELARQKLRDRARQLRNEQTDAEAKLWARLRARQISGVKFRRQHPIGPYVADFCCVEHRLIIEIDGGQHAEQMQSDQRRTAILKLHGFRVLRFWNNEVLANLDAVLEQIYQALNNPHPSLSLKGRGLKKKMTPIKGL
jgi:very-short-patch-repair endonuclease